MQTMKIAVTSDLHGNLPTIEECDLLLICGDIIPLELQTNMFASQDWLEGSFLPWCADCPAKKVVFIAGNHDFFFERKKGMIAEMMLPWNQDDVYYLNNEEIILDGVKIFGTPYCKIFGRWAFMREPERLQQYYSEIPENLDILISHDAPKIENFGVLLDNRWGPAPIDAGNPWLAEAIKEKKPKYAFCGHIHSGDHNMHQVDDTILANVSYVDEDYRPTNNILYFERS